MPAFERVTVNTALRTNVALGVTLSIFFFIVLRLWYLQVLQGEYFRSRSENNRLRTIFLPPPRGLILDREGRVIAKNRPAFDIDLVVEDAPDPKETVKNLAKVLGKDPEDLLTQLGPQKRRRRFEPKLLLKDVDRDTVAKVVGQKYGLPGIIINVSPTRDYVYGEIGSHVLGYIREINSRQLEQSDFSGYRTGDMVGQYGVEAQWEWFLQGKRGVQRVIVNATGTKIGEAGSEYEAPVPGHNITLTIDMDLQKGAEDAMKGKSGAVVALKVDSGEVLALVSTPGFDPNVFTQAVSTEVWKDLTGKEKKLSNRAVQGVYPPGSVFKIMMAVAGLSEGVMSPYERVSCPGWYQLGSRKFKCHKHSGHGSVDLREALIQSCDVYFYTMGQRLGVDRIHEYATKFGLGQKTGLRLVEEAAGLIPSTEWKRKYFRKPEDQKWYPGETPSVSIGQGAVTTTPIQIAKALSALVNGGKLMTPYLIKSIQASEGSFKDEDFSPEVTGTLGIDDNIIRTVKEGLLGVVNDPRGTAHRAKLDPQLKVNVAGKTGTAQVVSMDAHGGYEHHNDHAWFAAYAPAEKSEIVVVALVENGGHGGVAAAPVAQRVFDVYFRKKLGMPLVSEGSKKDGQPLPEEQNAD